jgi:hypothetical protein
MAAVLATGMAVVRCSNDDGGGPVGPVATQPTRARIVNLLADSQTTSTVRVDSVAFYGVVLDTAHLGFVGPGDTTAFATLSGVPSVTLDADSMVIFFQRCQSVSCTPAETTITALGPYTIPIDTAVQNTIILDTSIVSLSNVFSGVTTHVRADNRLVNLSLSSGGTADSVHVYGLRIGSTTIGLVRGGQVTAHQPIAETGTAVTLTVDSLVVVQETTRTRIAAPGSRTVSITADQQNTVVIDQAMYNIGALLPTGTTRVQIRNSLLNCTVETDSVTNVEMFNVRIGAVSYGNIAGGQSSSVLEVVPQGGNVTIRFGSVTVTKYECPIPGVCFEQLYPYDCVDSVTVAVQSTQTTVIDFTPSAAVTTDFWDGLAVCP